MYTCVYTSVHVQIFICTRTYECVCVCLRVYTYVYIYRPVCTLHMYTSVHVQIISMFTNVRVYVNVSARMRACRSRATADVLSCVLAIIG